ncbi:MAG: hypothetical protein NTU46_06735 [Burkholderiales bacterium]|nr:hypothetical protein [Burkholderiales bacterium]
MTADISSQKKRLRVAVLARIFSTSAGGAERYCASLVKHLASQHEIHVFAQDIRTQYPQVVFHQVPLFLSPSTLAESNCICHLHMVANA